MKRHHLFNGLGTIGLIMLLSFTVSADDPSRKNSVPIPHPPKAKQAFSPNQPCVEPLEIMRRNHGRFLKHHRYETMHQGIRTQHYSLVACINCHVTADIQGNYPNIHEGKEHFCRNCHVYAAVSIDCFECHTSQPESVSATNLP
jgi:hypothetical protein